MLLMSATGLYLCIPPSQKLQIYSAFSKPWMRMRLNKPSCFINETLLKEKLAQGLPNWARAQINRDLLPYNMLNSQKLDGIFAIHNTEHNRLVRVKIRNGTLTITPGNSSYITTRPYLVMKNVFEHLAKNNYLTNTDFILSLQDYLVLSGHTPVPIFTFAKDITIPLERNAILIPDWMNMRGWPELKPRIRMANKLFPWDQKKSLLFWRGGFADQSGFRHILVSLSATFPNIIDAQFSQNDIKLYKPPEYHVEYKYQANIDGSRAAWERLVWQLSSNSLTLKHKSNHIQWFYSGISKQNEYLDITTPDSLFEAIQWSETNPDQAKHIIDNANKFAENNLSLEAMYQYWIEVLQSYSKKLN